MTFEIPKPPPTILKLEIWNCNSTLLDDLDQLVGYVKVPLPLQEHEVISADTLTFDNSDVYCAASITHRLDDPPGMSWIQKALSSAQSAVKAVTMIRGLIALGAVPRVQRQPLLLDKYRRRIGVPQSQLIHRRNLGGGEAQALAQRYPGR